MVQAGADACTAWDVRYTSTTGVLEATICSLDDFTKGDVPRNERAPANKMAPFVAEGTGLRFGGRR